MKLTAIKITSVLLLVAVMAVILWPQTTLAGYAFWYGTGISRVTMENPDNPSKPFILRPGLTQEQANALATAAGNVVQSLNLNVNNNNPRGDQFKTIWDQGKTWDGYTLLSLLMGYDDADGKTYNSILVDMDGKIVKKWQLGGLAKMLPNGSVMGGMGTSADPVVFPYLVQQDWCGNVYEWVWKGSVEHAWPAERDWGRNNNRCDTLFNAGNIYSTSNPLGCKQQVFTGDLLVSGWHHDFQREGSPVGYYFPGAERTSNKKGKTLILSKYDPPISVTCPDPNDAEHCISKYRLQDDAIYIVDWNGNVEFEWFCYQHFDEFGFLPAAREAIRETYQGARNNPEYANDYLHSNNVNWVGQNRWWEEGDERFNPEYIIWDSRVSNITAIIATSDSPKGAWKKGDIVWKIGPNYQPPFNPEFRLGQIIGQHMAHIIPKGLPGAGNVLLFDNGGGAGWGSLFEGAGLLYDPTSPLFDLDGRPNLSRKAVYNTMNNFSRVIEFNPKTMEIVWQFAQPSPTADLDGDGSYRGNERLFYSFYISGAQRLPNGNTLITEGATGRVFEVTSANEVVWEFISPFRGGGTGVPTTVGPVYRAYRIPYKWAPTDTNCR